MGMRPRRRPTHGLDSRIRTKDHSTLAGEYTAITVRQRNFAVPDLALVAFAAHLPHRFDDDEHPIHARMGVRQTAAIGVHGEISAWRGALSRYKRATFTFFTKTQIFYRNNLSNGKAIMNLGNFNIGKFNSCLL